MKNITISMCGIAMGLFLPGNAHAVTFDFVGVVSSIRDESGLIGNNISVGDPFSGHITFDETALDTDPDGDDGDYTDAIQEWVVNVGGETFVLVDPSQTFIFVHNEDPPGAEDVYQLFTFDIEPSFGGAQWRANWFFSDPTSQALSDDSLPTGGPDLSIFTDGSPQIFAETTPLATSVFLDFTSITDREPESDTVFSIAVLPDTQMYVEQHPEIFEAQVDWIVANATEENIIYVAHLGDLKDDLDCDNKDVNNGTGDGRKEWQIVNDGFAVLDAADIPYGVVPGNHDFEQINETCPTDFNCAEGESETCAQRPLGIEDTTGATFNSVLGPWRFNNPSGPGYQPTYGDLIGSGSSSTIRDGNRRAGTNEDNFSLVDFDGVGFVIINLGYREDTNALAPGETSACSSTTNPEISWADGLLSDYSDRLGIVTSHAFLDENTSDPGRNEFNDYGASIYTCLQDNPNLLMMLAAHERGEAWRREITGRSVDLPVHILLADYQSANYLLPGGGVPTTDVDFRSLDGSNSYADGGFMRIMRFDTDTGAVTVETFAPAVSFADPVTGDPLTYPDLATDNHDGHWHDGLGAGDSRERAGLTSVYSPAIPVNSATGRIRFNEGAGMDRNTASNFCFTYRGYRVGVTEPAPDDAACPITIF